MPTVVAVTHLLRNEKEYTRAVAEIDEILAKNPREGSAADDRLELLSVLVKDYEDRTLPPVDAPSPQAVVDFMLEQKGMKRTDLAEHMGGRGRVSDFFTGARPQLSTNQIRRLRDLLGIPADLLLPAE